MSTDTSTGLTTGDNLRAVLVRLAALRDELQAWIDDEDRNRQLAVEYALDELDSILGER